MSATNTHIESDRRNGPIDAVSRRTDTRALLGGGSLLALAMMVANGGNYGLNLFLGRWLAPAQFADANLMVTIMFVMMALAVALQITTARAVPPLLLNGLHPVVVRSRS